MKNIKIETKDAPMPIGPYSQAILSGDTLYVSGQIPLNPITGNLVDSSYPIATKQVMDNIGAILNASGMGYENIVKSTIFLLDMNEFPAVNAVYASYFDLTDRFPARETVAVAGLPKGAMVEISVIAVR